MRRAATVAVVALIAGCGGSAPLDVCGGRADCLAVHVEGSGSITRIDQLGLDLTGAITLHGRDPATAGAAIDLPVAVAVLFPGGRTGQVQVVATGFLTGARIGGGSVVTQVASGGNESVTVTLRDDGASDGGAPPDLAGHDAAVAPIDLAWADVAGIDQAGQDFASALDAGAVDMTIPADLAKPDLGPPPPVLSSVTPPSGSTNGGLAITVKGNNFVNGATLTIDGRGVFQVTVVDAKTITAVTPSDPGRLGKVNVMVRNPDGQSATAPLFSYFLGNINFNSQNILLQQFQALRAVAAADFDLDGQPDLVVTGQSKQAQLSVQLLIDNKGNFNNQLQPIGNGQNGHSVVVDDVNMDGFPDAVVAYVGSGTVGVAMNAAGVLQAGASYPVMNAGSPEKIAVGDLNADGALDLVIADSVGNDFGVYLSDKAGGFLGETVYSVLGNQPWSVAVADLNKDGRLDVVVAMISSAQVSVSFGTGNGKFAAPVAYPTGPSPHDVAIGDLNGDGAPDLVVPLNSGSAVDVLLNKGDGSFLPVVTYPAANLPSDAALADFDGDGNLDVAVTCTGGNSVALLLGAGDGTLGPRMNLNAQQPMGLAIADFDGDGLLDIATVGQTQLTVLRNNSK